MTQIWLGKNRHTIKTRRPGITVGWLCIF